VYRRENAIVEERYPWMLFRGEQIIRGSFKESQNPIFLETIKERITKRHKSVR